VSGRPAGLQGGAMARGLLQDGWPVLKALVPSAELKVRRFRPNFLLANDDCEGWVSISDGAFVMQHDQNSAAGHSGKNRMNATSV
jgi:hypothetical protein